MQFSRKTFVSMGLTVVMVALLGGVVYQMQFGRNFSTNTKASSNDVTLGLSQPSLSMKPGEEKVVNITATSTNPSTPYHISAADLVLSYPKDVVTITSIEPDTGSNHLVTLKPLSIDTSGLSGVASITLGAECSDATKTCTVKPANGYLAVVKLRAIKAGSGSLSFVVPNPANPNVTFTQLAAIEVTNQTDKNIAKRFTPMTLTVLSQSVSPVVPTSTVTPTITRTPTAIPTAITRPSATPTPTVVRIPTSTPTPTPKPQQSMVCTTTKVCIYKDNASFSWICKFNIPSLFINKQVCTPVNTFPPTQNAPVRNCTSSVIGYSACPSGYTSAGQYPNFPPGFLKCCK